MESGCLRTSRGIMRMPDASVSLGKETYIGEIASCWVIHHKSIKGIFMFFKNHMAGSNCKGK